ncbi:hypothetical protein [Candidatus Gromoviella agglomerans]|uniref:hypothetical protein n=1 Tax=Candidatus Gromoviella agglomerans TaxID=2806609 RepID=UPI001E5774C7|nr:hypothetical protein [Candidatus Gromoviella agglomerans]UFX98240.1 hypothetical protein Gromo_00123 [Candidatus Gromoviella agglomerans]
MRRLLVLQQALNDKTHEVLRNSLDEIEYRELLIDAYRKDLHTLYKEINKEWQDLQEKVVVETNEEWRQQYAKLIAESNRKFFDEVVSILLILLILLISMMSGESC